MKETRWALVCRLSLASRLCSCRGCAKVASHQPYLQTSHEPTCAPLVNTAGSPFLRELEPFLPPFLLSLLRPSVAASSPKTLNYLSLCPPVSASPARSAQSSNPFSRATTAKLTALSSPPLLLALPPGIHPPPRCSKIISGSKGELGPPFLCLSRRRTAEGGRKRRTRGGRKARAHHLLRLGRGTDTTSTCFRRSVEGAR